MMGLEKSMVEGSIALDRIERHARPEKRRKSLLDLDLLFRFRHVLIGGGGLFSAK
jgi:hypothetical protein